MKQIIKGLLTMIKIIIVVAIFLAVFSTDDLALTNSVSQQDDERIAIKDRIAKNTPASIDIIEKVKGMKPLVNEKLSVKSLGKIIKDYEEGKGAFKLTAIGWEASQKQNGYWRIFFHYQKDTLEYVKAEWEFNPETNKLYPFEFQNARWFWTRTGRYGVEQMK
jgi:hypothetical protein